MSPVIRISDHAFKRLQKYATPLVDTAPTVIDKLLDYCDSRDLAEVLGAVSSSIPVSNAGPDPSRPREFGPDEPPDLRHTRVLFAEFDGDSADGWNELVGVAHERAMGDLGSFDSLRSVSLSHIVSGEHHKEGFHYIPGIDVSIQYVDSNSAWRNSLHLARRVGCSLRVQFEWRNKKGAAYPGQSGVMSWSPSVK
jgi:hypothetical protein